MRSHVPEAPRATIARRAVPRAGPTRGVPFRARSVHLAAGRMWLRLAQERTYQGRPMSLRLIWASAPTLFVVACTLPAALDQSAVALPLVVDAVAVCGDAVVDAAEECDGEPTCDG